MELVIRDEHFPCRDTLPAWATLKLAKATQGGDQEALAGMYDLVMAQLLPAERERFDEYMTNLEPAVPFDELNEAIGALMTSYTARPTAPHSPSAAGQSTTEQPSRVVSLSRPAGAQSESSTNGEHAAS